MRCICRGRARPARACKADGLSWEGCGPHMCGPYCAVKCRGGGVPGAPPGSNSIIKGGTHSWTSVFSATSSRLPARKTSPGRQKVCISHNHPCQNSLWNWKRSSEISYDLEETTGDIYIGGSVSESGLAAATELRNKYSGIRFHFYSGDAIDVSERLDPEVCFLPLEPKLPTQLALVWKKHAVFSNAAKVFYKLFL